MTAVHSSHTLVPTRLPCVMRRNMNLHHHKKNSCLNLHLFIFTLYSGRGSLYTISALNKHHHLNASEEHSDKGYTYRVIHDLWTLLQEVISYVFMIKKVHINMYLILDG
jgi:hypothetical protein